MRVSARSRPRVEGRGNPGCFGFGLPDEARLDRVRLARIEQLAGPQHGNVDQLGRAVDPSLELGLGQVGEPEVRVEPSRGVTMSVSAIVPDLGAGEGGDDVRPPGLRN